MTKLAEGPASENAKKILEAEKKASDKSRADYQSRMKGKPTPTQEENDLAMCGAQFIEHEPDGSDLDPGGGPPTLEPRHMEAERPARGYTTRGHRAE